MIYMYAVLVKVDKSNIDGQGVFAIEDIPKGTIAWIFKEKHDIKLSAKEYDSLSSLQKQKMDKTGYLSPWTGFWVFPSDNDPAQFTNHSNDSNLSVAFDKSISTEPYFVANRDITKGEELTNNYNEFDKITQKTKPIWAK
jgi:SET domain-containing protein